MNLFCQKKCCMLIVHPYIYNKETRKKKNKKAGAVIHDPISNKIILVQSRGNLWGVPKGTIHKDEDYVSCCIREVKEETGLNIKNNDFESNINLYGSNTYFYIQKEMCSLKVQDHIKNNDANGIGWININCLNQMISSEIIKISHHTKLLLKHFFYLKI